MDIYKFFSDNFFKVAMLNFVVCFDVKIPK